MHTFPENHPADPEPVLVALEVGRAMWGRGDHRGAMKWLRQALDDAFDSGLDERGLELSKLAASLASDPSLAPPSSFDDDPVDLEVPTRSSSVPAVSVRTATGRFVTLGGRVSFPPVTDTAAATTALPEVVASPAPTASPSSTPLARMALRQSSVSVAPVMRSTRAVAVPANADAPCRRAWGAAVALRVALRGVNGGVKARLLVEGESAAEGEVEATVLAPGADHELRALFSERLDDTG